LEGFKQDSPIAIGKIFKLIVYNRVKRIKLAINDAYQLFTCKIGIGEALLKKVAIKPFSKVTADGMFAKSGLTAYITEAIAAFQGKEYK
jgi:hypothetical protein